MDKYKILKWLGSIDPFDLNKSYNQDLIEDKLCSASYILNPEVNCTGRCIECLISHDIIELDFDSVEKIF